MNRVLAMYYYGKPDHDQVVNSIHISGFFSSERKLATILKAIFCADVLLTFFGFIYGTLSDEGAELGFEKFLKWMLTLVS